MRVAIIVMAFVALAGCWVVQAAPETCDHFEPMQVVVTYDGMEGMVFDYKGRNGKCFYMVRGQRGTEMPMTDWYHHSELDNAYEE